MVTELNMILQKQPDKHDKKYPWGSPREENIMGQAQKESWG